MEARLKDKGFVVGKKVKVDLMIDNSQSKIDVKKFKVEMFLDILVKSLDGKFFNSKRLIVNKIELEGVYAGNTRI